MCTVCFAFMKECKRISNKAYISHIISLGYREIFWMNNPTDILPNNYDKTKMYNWNTRWYTISRQPMLVQWNLNWSQMQKIKVVAGEWMKLVDV